MITKFIPIMNCQLCTPEVWEVSKPSLGIYRCINCGKLVKHVIVKRRKNEKGK